MTDVVVIGAAGRMGRALIRAAAEFPDLRISGAIVSQTSDAIGSDAGELAGIARSGVKVTSDLAAALAGADVAVDFSNAQATESNLAVCRASGKALFIGTTGFTPESADLFAAAATDIPLLVAPNTSIAVTLLAELVRETARALSADFDIEIVEAHHRTKRDAPSGTALALGRAAAEGRGVDFEGSVASDPNTRSPRKSGDIGFAVVRGGDIVGDHTVIFAGNGERLTLIHQATDRAIFARGALRGAAWLASRPAGRYFMRDIVTTKSKT